METAAKVFLSRYILQGTLLPVFSNVLLSQHNYFPKALIEDSHVYKGVFIIYGGGLAIFLKLS